MRKLFFLSIVCVLFSLNFENIRLLVFGIPIYIAEIFVLISYTLFFLSKFPKAHTPHWVYYWISFIFLGVLSSLLFSSFGNSSCRLSWEGFLHGLGIFKSWFVFPILFGWILFQLTREKNSRETHLFILTISFLPLIVSSLLMAIFGSGMTYDGRLRGNLSSPNMLAMSITPTLLLSWYFFRFFSKKQIRPSFAYLEKKWIFGGYFLFLFTLLFFTKSYSAWVAVFSALFFFEVIYHNHFSKKIFSILGLFLILASFFVFSQWKNPRFEGFFDIHSRSSFASRIMIWRSAGYMIADSPFFGIGPGNFQSCYLFYQRYFPPYLEWSVPEPHNIFLAFWLGGGLIGVVGFIGIIVWWWQKLIQKIKKRDDNLLSFLICASIMMAILIHGLVDTTYWRESLAFIFWIIFFVGLPSSKSNVSLSAL